MTISQAKAFAASNEKIMGFTYNKVEKNPLDNQGQEEVVHIWFKSKLNVLYNETWWSYSAGKGME